MIILFKVKRIASGDDEFGGMPPFMPAMRPSALGNTPFGRTDSDIKGPTIPKPILLPVLRKLQFVQRTKVQPMPGVVLRIFGVTKNSTGVPLGGCAVDLFETVSKRYVASTVSDGSGNYEFRSASLSTAYQVVAYLPGSPDVAGVTVNTLVGVI